MDVTALMDDVIAERSLQLTSGPDIVVRFFRPVEKDQNFSCAYQIIWLDRERCFYGAGVDGVQALLAAMCNAHADLLTSPEGKNGVIRWCENEVLGLPLAGSFSPEDFK